ncbi:MFS transporter [Micromonospora pisi]|uniref:MFS transporter n=1 Tax=Micromonospora pisi TaxID=589240 RepID=A0A495JD86_9ACTN|nr:MFS transporter [Micromonospora pisi]RKR86478.1 MFS transporter [Micromonospora pisi]
MTTFLPIWAGRLISVLGSKTSAFALSLWVYQQTQSITQYSIGLFLAFVPGLLLSPWAGVLVDRHRRRTILLCADAVALSASVALVAGQSTGHLAVWHIYLLVAVQSGCAAFQWPALSAAVTTMVPSAQRGRAGAMTQTALSTAQLLSPTLSTALLSVGGLTVVLLVDAASIAFGLLTLAVVRFPEPGAATGPVAADRSGWRAEIRVGRRLIRDDRRLVHLLRLATALFAVQAAAPVLLLPLILADVPPSRQSVAVAVVSTAAGLGLASGSLAMSLWRGPRRRFEWIRAATVVSAAAVIVAGLHPRPVVLCVAAFVFSFGVPVVVSCSQVLWQDAITPEAQGRVFALRRMFVQAGTIAGLLAAGPLVATTAAVFGVGTRGGSMLLLASIGTALAATALVTPTQPDPVVAATGA